MTQGTDNHDAPHGRAVEVSFDIMAQLLGGAKARDVLASVDGAQAHIEALDGPRRLADPRHRGNASRARARCASWLSRRSRSSCAHSQPS